MVMQLADGRFAKDCPSCGVQQTYLRKNYALASEKAGKLCKKCANRKAENNGHSGFYKDVLRASFVHKYKTGAETRGIEWGVSFDYLADLLIEQDFKCALSDAPLDAMEVSNNCSLDRIDSSKGYIEGNVQWVTSMINMCKQSYTQEDFIVMCKAVADKVKW
tara:strand:- start:1099 stop:1584 length:486 start_codon:yes stop_codon:yes gene_type:complete